MDPAPRVTRRYRPGTLILETEFVTADGAVTVIDFMPLRGTCSDLVRTVVGRRGRVAMRTEVIFRFDYGATVPWVTSTSETCINVVAGPDRVVFTGEVPLRGEGLSTVGEFSVGAGESVSFVMTYAPSHKPAPRAVDHRLDFGEARGERFFSHDVRPPPPAQPLPWNLNRSVAAVGLRSG